MVKRQLNFWFWLGLCYLSMHQTLCSLNVITGGDLSDYLWNETYTLRNAAMDSVVIQELKNGSLDPTMFGGNMVQEIVFLHFTKESIDVAASNTTDQELKQILQGTATAYQSDYTELAKEWQLNDPLGMKLGTGFSDYINHLNNVARTMEPIYFMVAMIPVERLWPWMGLQLDVDNNFFGVYTSWVRTHFDPSYKEHEKYEVAVNNANKNGTIDKAKALSVYEQSMRGEAEFFSVDADESGATRSFSSPIFNWSFHCFLLVFTICSVFFV